MGSMGDIPVFVAVADCRGFAAAARLLGVSKSAVSKRITSLEKRLGVQLFHRSTRNISLTEAGEHFFVHATQALESAKDAEESVLTLNGTPKGRLRVSVPMSFGHLHVAPLIADFLAVYPGIEVDLIMDDRFVDMVSEGIDLAIRGGTMIDSSLIVRKIAPIRNIVVAAPSYVERCGQPASIKDLVNHNCLQYSLTRDFQEWVFETKKGTQKVPVSGSYRVNNGEALRQAVVRGVGISRLPTFIAGPDLATGRLVRVLPQYQIPTQSLFAVFPERRHLPNKVRLFLDFIIDRIGGDHPLWDKATGSVQ